MADEQLDVRALGERVAELEAQILTKDKKRTCHRRRNKMEAVVEETRTEAMRTPRTNKKKKKMREKMKGKEERKKERKKKKKKKMRTPKTIKKKKREK